MFLVAGFFGAARQHFSSIDYGIKNSKLRQQVEELEAENRRLLSPGEIKKFAKGFGMVELSASNIEIFSTAEGKSVKEKTSKPLVEKTVDAKPAKETLIAKISKPEKETLDRTGKDGKALKNAETKPSKNSKTAK